MSRIFYCSECGSELVNTRMAVPKKGIILDLIESHECGEKVNLLELFSKGDDICYNPLETEPKKTVQNLNELFPHQGELKDLRSKDHTKETTAPLTILDQLRKDLKHE